MLTLTGAKGASPPKPTYPNLFIDVAICGHMWVYVGMWAYAYVGICGHLHMWSYVGICGHMWAYLCICWYMCAYVGICGHIWPYVGICRHM